MALTNTGWKLEHTYSKLPETLFSKASPIPVSNPKLVVYNKALASELGLDLSTLTEHEISNLFSGNTLPEGAYPIAQAYAGHQFGHFTMLGDGRAILIGEQVTPLGERFDVQLKGPGQTPYSRRGDGRAALGPMLREYIISEAMHALGIPTTRSLAVVTTGENVFREKELPGAILTRVAASHIRVGTFEYLAAKGDESGLKALTDYTINRHYPKLMESEDRYSNFLTDVVTRQASLVANWMLVGFIHGVMNTDNMAVSGETIDYGPCAFMDQFSMETVFSSIDSAGRYSYGNQPGIAQWNLSRFAETLLPLLHGDPEEAKRMAITALGSFSHTFNKHWLNGMKKKLGFISEEAEDEEYIKPLLEWMDKNGADWTYTFRSLLFADEPIGDIYQDNEFKDWRSRWRNRIEQPSNRPEEARELMRRSNPAYIARNSYVEEALTSAQSGDLSKFNKLLSALSSPFEEKSEYSHLLLPPPRGTSRYVTFCGT